MSNDIRLKSCSGELCEKVIKYCKKRKEVLKSLKIINSTTYSSGLIKFIGDRGLSDFGVFKNIERLSFSQSKQFTNLALSYFLKFQLSNLKYLDIS